MVRVLALGQYLTKLRVAKCQIFAESAIYHIFKYTSHKLLTVSKRNHQRASRSIMNRMMCFFRYLERTFVMHNIPEGNNVTLTEKIARGQTGPKALINIRNGREAL